ncbi:MAG TPA: tRNA (N(6)-L-threonylcarbamoyladenosine(37)-C(2))-methylthiotransferase MtaB [Methylomusa anaerophila]|uniref:Threonylcarbamoyladenosine tRNA methylthiotransferase MtaB n=1 Tax=Methylomusa anaerophila TaxID=1930071 RepID=A0A348ANY2_9FIRM|nr:tRNA (N(6)-L-threonylcarbamoyladenosine(37)-C(2))-methylthiotransferase MtaB [Methylomusa anaerophila]BBB92780.1 threonylcarbamoyladenosine tRNA methylthiotransferase MtaB [Methylomusa anaerophila]HML87369.1 tRNA (N(6)-L-threonylcarbamoyladenosine(37)-C(2))-methylthiotransferase MtaB [Methylomusa anaerophila]
MPQAAFTTLGCKVNQYETQVMQGLFIVKGYEIVDFSRQADVYVINTCSVTHLGERKSRQLIRRAQRLNPAATIVVTGCYAQVSPAEVANIKGVDLIIGTQDRGHMVELIENRKQNHKFQPLNAVTDIMAAKQYEDIPLFSLPGRTRAFLKIQEGCTNFCTYCIIPYARGPLRSRPLASIVKEASKLVEAGFQEIVLTGIHLGAYGRDLANNGEIVSLVDAVQAVLDINELTRLRLGSLESIEVSDKLIDIMEKDVRLCGHLHLPLQSGDDTILNLMNRHYTAAQYLNLIEGIKKRVPGIAITTDVIVGFPGETEAMFANTVSLGRTIKFAGMHVFPYSRRTGTPAAEFTCQIAEYEKKRRVQVMQGLAEEMAKEYRCSFIGKIRDVLFEAEPGGDAGVTAATNSGIISGFTENYIRVYAKGEQTFLGQIRGVELTANYLDGLWGKIME